MIKLFNYYSKKINLFSLPLLIINLINGAFLGYYLNDFVNYALYHCSSVNEAVFSLYFYKLIITILIFIITIFIDIIIYILNINKIKESKFTTLDQILPYSQYQKNLNLKLVSFFNLFILFISLIISISAINIYLDYQKYQDAFLLINSISNNLNEVIKLPILNISLIILNFLLLVISLVNALFNSLYIKKNKINVILFIIYFICFFCNYFIFSNNIIIANVINFLFSLALIIYSTFKIN